MKAKKIVSALAVLMASLSLQAQSNGSVAGGAPAPPPIAGQPQAAFSLQYIEIQVGAGPVAEPNKLYKVYYTGWLAADGKKFDSSYDHRQPLLDKDGKPVVDAAGQPQLGEAQPILFPQGFGRVIPGWDQGFAGMKVGGKRRILIPWQLAYGAMGRPPVIPARADLIFDVELLEVLDMPQPQARPAAPVAPQAPEAPRAPAAPAAPQAR